MRTRIPDVTDKCREVQKIVKKIATHLGIDVPDRDPDHVRLKFPQRPECPGIRIPVRVEEPEVVSREVCSQRGDSERVDEGFRSSKRSLNQRDSPWT